MKSTTLMAATLTFLLSCSSALAMDGGDRIENRLDRRGDRIDQRLDRSADVI